MGGKAPGPIARAALLLGVFAILGTGLVAVTRTITVDRIEQNERAALVRRLHEILPAEAYDNDLLEDTRRIRAPEGVGTEEPVTVYRALDEGEPVAAVTTVVAPDGYNGAIRLLVGVWRDGTLAGVRVLSHQETPGLGDAIEASKSDWIEGLAGRSLGDPPREDWTVEKDGGAFDQLTGATITPRAVIRAIRDFLIYSRAHDAELFGTGRPAGETDTRDGDGG